MESADSIHIFTTISNLSLLLVNNVQHVFLDNTFLYAHKDIRYMYIINVFYLPIIYVFMEIKLQ